MLCNAKQLAEWYNVDPRTVTNWQLEDPPIPSEKRGKVRWFDTAAVARWMEQRAIRRAPAPPPPDLEEAKARKLSAEAELAEYQLAQARGEFIAVADLDAKVGPMLDTFRAKLLAIPGRLAPHVVACRDIADARDLLERELAMVLAELSA